MGLSRKLWVALLSVAGGAMTTMATTTPREADTAVQAWLSVFGWENPPAQLVSQHANTAVLVLGLLFLAVAVVGLLEGAVKRRRENPYLRLADRPPSYIKAEVARVVQQLKRLRANAKMTEEKIFEDKGEISKNFLKHSIGLKDHFEEHFKSECEALYAEMMKRTGDPGTDLRRYMFTQLLSASSLDEAIKALETKARELPDQ